MHIVLNLLPPQKKAALHSNFIFAFIQSALFVLFLLMIFVSGTIIAVRIFLVSMKDELTARTTSTPKEYLSVIEDIKHTNEYIKKVNLLQNRFIPWSTVLEKITLLIPSGIHLEHMRINKDGGVSMSGVAATRNDMLLLQTNLETSTMFKDLQSPLSNILQPKNVKFDLQMQYIVPSAK